MTKIKICGLKRQADIEMVNELKPELIGFVFANSSRRISMEQAWVLKKMLIPGIMAVGVFVNESLNVVEEICQRGIIDIVQLHGDEDALYIEELKTKISQPVIKAVRVQSREQIMESLKLSCEYLLLDTYTKGQYGGSGQTFDRTLIPQMDKPFFLAGGLNADNVLEAIRECSPYGVDVSSAVEQDGHKDKKKIKKFIERIRNHE